MIGSLWQSLVVNGGVGKGSTMLLSKRHGRMEIGLWGWMRLSEGLLIPRV